MSHLLCNTHTSRHPQLTVNATRTVRIVLAVLVAVAALGFLAETGICSDVQGVVSDAATGLPVSGATVILWETQDTVTTNASGEYFFASAPAGATLVFGKQGYAAGSGSAVSCDCPHQADYDADFFLTSLDLGSMIDVLFTGKPDFQDPKCPTVRMDFDYDGFETSLDLGAIIDHLFAGGPPPADPCAAK